MKGWSPQQIAEASGARLIAAGADGGGPERVVIDSREAGPGALFVGLRGENVDGGAFAARALEAGAWGVLVAPDHGPSTGASRGAVLAAADPLLALKRLARAWRRALHAQ